MGSRVVFALVLAALAAPAAADTCTSAPWDGMAGVPPLTEFPADYLYLGTYPGFLYDGSNAIPADHEADGAALAADVRPRDTSGNLCAPGSPGCKIVFLSIGFSNNTIEFCGGQGIGGDPDDPQATACPLPIASPPYIQTESFIAQALADARVDHTNVVLVDGAQGGKTLGDWDPVTSGYTEYNRVRDQILTPSGLSPLQVQAIWVKDANSTPTVSLATGDATHPADAIVAERHLGNILRAIRAAYPHVRQVFVSPRIYGGYANTMVPPNGLNPEPYAYELGFSIKWLVKAQVDQARGAVPDADAGDLDYKKNAAPWVAWGPYLWANGTTPRGDGLAWLDSDFRANECTHPSINAERKVARQLLQFLVASPETSWFLAAPSTCGIAGGSLRLGADKSTISWSSIGVAGPFDLAAGDLGALRAAGSFASAGCLAEAVSSSSVSDPTVPAPGEAIYYLVRCDAGTWDDGTQAGNRDATLTICP